MTDSVEKTHRFWGSRPLPDTKVEFFNAITTASPGASDSVATIRMYGPIDSWGGVWGISTADMGEVLDALPETVSQIILRVNSPGGEVFEGISILNMLRAHKAKVTCVVDGLAASAASVIAAGCDETVMSPGTQLMIHSPWTISMGNAADLRRSAAQLDGIQESLVEIYRDKAGDADWTSVLAAETWYTAAEAVSAGLADRVTVVPDAGESFTPGLEPDTLTVVDLPGEGEAAARSTQIAAFATDKNKLPRPSGLGSSRKENGVDMTDNFLTGVRERLGVSADATEDTVLAELDAALAELPKNATEEVATPVATVPEGAIILDKAVHEELLASAAAGREALDMLTGSRRDDIVQKALTSGRISASSKVTWREALDKDEASISAILDSLSPSAAVPVSEIGVSDDATSSEEALYAAAWPTARKESN
ncbi:Clp protease-like protein [Rathayibacter phage NCPPB3778]|nr:Clp protease-like protein [Rathayibacter phage NCPPB3778]